MGRFYDVDGDWVTIEYEGDFVWLDAREGDRLALCQFTPATARLIAAALIEAADKAEAGQ